MTLNREVLSASEAVYDGCQEQPIDLEDRKSVV